MSNMSLKDPQKQTEGAVPESARLRAVIASPDFLVGVPAGFLLAVLPALIPQLLVNGFAFFITLAGISAAVAALVLTPMTMILGALTPTMRALLAKVPGGAAGTLVPFAQVTVIAAASCVTSIVGAILAPLAPGTFPAVVWIGTAIPLGLFLWALIGCVQVTMFLIKMYRTSQRAEDLTQQMELAKSERRARG